MKQFISFIIILFIGLANVLSQSINPPTQTFPANGAVNIDVRYQLDWSGVSGNQGYLYEVDITSSFNSSLKISGATTRNVSNFFTSNLFFGQTYYWRVATISSIDTSVWSSTRSFTTINEPVLTAPANNASNIEPGVTIDWSPINGVQRYFYEVDTTLNFNSTRKVSGATFGNSSNFSVTDLRFDQTYYWRVAAENSVDTSAWSAARSFQTMASLGLSTPLNFATNVDVEETIDWDFVQGNSGYIYQIDSSINFNSPLQRTVGTFGNVSQALVQNLRFGTTYYWRVAVKTASDTSDWSTVYRFTTTDQVSLFQPPNNAVNQQISETIDWSFVAGNNGYIYQYDTAATLNSPLLQQVSSTVNSSQAVISNLRFGTTYYWRVAAKTTSDTSQWSAVYRFTTLDQLNLLNPTNGATGRNTTESLNWGGILGNAGYVYELDTVATFNSPLLLQNSFTANVSQVTVSDLRFGTTYYWRVAAKSNNDTSQWSSAFSFTTRDDVSLISPTNNSTIFGVETLIDWSGLGGASGYIYELDTAISFNSSLLRQLSNSNSFSQATVSNLKYGTTYYWRVAAKNNSDTSGWSSIRSFTTLGNVLLTAPNNNSTSNFIEPTLDWSSSIGSTGYIYQLDSNINFNSPLYFSDALNSTLSQVDAPVLRYGTRYYWRVKATTATDTSQWSVIRNFTTFDNVNLSFPVNNASNLPNTVTISWGSRLHGSYYIYEVDENSLFNSPNKIVGNTAGTNPLSVQGTRVNISGLQYGQDYFWRVAAVSPIDTSGWGVEKKFSTAFLLPNAPTQLFPANGATNVQRRNLVLDWTDDTSATGYEVQLDTTNNLNTTTNISTLNSSQWSLSRRENFTTYYWRVRATNNSGNSPWSPVWSFTTEDCDNSDTLVVVNCGTFIYRGVLYSNTGFYQRGLLNAAGCDSTVYLDITINQPTASNISLTGCDSLAFNGQTYFSSGNYTQVLQNSKGCDSTISLNLTINNSTITPITAAVCDSFVWARTNQTYFNSGVYFDTLQTTTGCDSVAILDLLVTPTTTSSFTVTSCDSFAWRGSTLTQSGIYMDTIVNGANCDSIITLDLTISQTKTNLQTVDVCKRYNWNGRTLTTSGTYFDTLSTASGCDSLLTLNLNVRDSSVNNLNFTVCDSIRINGQLITQTAIYTQIFTNSVGCDSVLTLDVVVNNSTSSTVAVSACNSYFWSSTNRTYNATGIYDTTFTTVTGCDSLVSLDLTITSNSTIVQQNGFRLTVAQTNATYQWLDCNNGNAVIIGETGRLFTAQQNGSYAVEVSRGNCLDTSSCILVTSVGLNSVDETSNEIKIYPNPNNGSFFIDAPSNLLKNKVVLVYNVQGKMVYSGTLENGKKQINLDDIESGIYLLRVGEESIRVVVN